MTELERYKGAMKIALEVLDVCTRHMENERYTASTITDLARINVILNPPQEFENVEVVRLMCNKCERVQGAGFNPAVEVCFCHETGQPLDEWTYTELTGTIRRPVPQKVERSVSVNGEMLDDGGFEVNRPFDGFPECHDKRGVLTFTWAE